MKIPHLAKVRIIVTVPKPTPDTIPMDWLATAENARRAIERGINDITTVIVQPTWVEEESMESRGEARFHISDDSEDPSGNPPKPERDDWPDEGLRRFPESMSLIEEAIVGAITEQFISNARAQAAAVANPVTREQLRECIEVAERAKR